MNAKELFMAVGEISDDLIMEAYNPVKSLRRRRRLKITLPIAAIIMLIGLSAFAAVNLISGRVGYSKSSPDYYSLPSPQTLQQDIGVKLKLIEEFSNGYRFENASIVHQEDIGQDGTVLEKYNGISCKYALSGAVITLHADGAATPSAMKNDKAIETYRNSELKYMQYTNKCVPPDYQQTPQDQEDEKSGKLVFSYGSSEVELYEVKQLEWDNNGINYTFVATNNSLTKEQFVQMAKEIIDYQDGGI